MSKQLLEELKGYRKMLYVVDMVNGFINEGPLHDQHIKTIIPETIELIEKFKQEQEGVAFIQDNHQPDSIEFKTFSEHCLEVTTESLIIPELEPYTKDSLIYKKNSTSAIFAPHMLEDLNTMSNLQEAIAIGCCTDICILNFLIPLKNYFNQKNQEVTIFAIKNAMDTYNSETHNREEYTNLTYKLLQLSGIILVDDINKMLKREKGLIRRKERK